MAVPRRRARESGRKLAATANGPAIAGPFVFVTTSGRTGSVYDAIVRRHGLFLKDRGRTSIYGKNIPRAVVFIADTEYGIIETMRNLPADRYEMVRYYPDTEASAKFGSQYMGGVIQLIPRYE
jgi:hypothetical protein